MSGGDQGDFFARIKRVIPARWFGPSSPLVDALVQGLANSSAFVYTLYLYAKLQTRILTATDGWLDMVAADFFGAALQRSANQSDASFRASIIINIFRERGTRNAITKVLTDLTGRAPVIFEPQRPLDTGAYGAPNCGYGAAGGYGSLLLPYQAFVKAYRPLGSGIPKVGGYVGLPVQAGAGYPMWGAFIPTLGTTVPGVGGYGIGQIEYATLSQSTNAVSDADIYAAIDSVKPVASTIWTQINS